MSQMVDESELRLALLRQQAGSSRDAEEIYRRLLARTPQVPELHYNLGTLLSTDGRPEEAIEAYKNAIAFDPLYADALNNLGILLAGRGMLDEAIDAYRRAIAATPGHLAALNNLGNVLRQRGDLDEAILCYQQAITIGPAVPTTLNNLGSAFKDAGRLDDALRAFHQSLLLDATVPETHNHLGAILKMVDRLDDASMFYEQALQLRPDYVEAMNNLGLLCKDLARLDEAVNWFERALAIRPPRADVHSNLIYTLVFKRGAEARLSHELQRWNALHAKRFESARRTPAIDKQFARKLRIGYVSPDFRDHCAASFLFPLLASHDREGFEIHCFASVLRPDSVTGEFMALADHWHSARSWSDDEMAERIRDAEIDILVDCTLHMADHRLLVFARKPAPLQITWLGYPGSTGLTAMDYRMTDVHLEQDDQSGTPEKPYRLKETFWCYDPLVSEPEVNELPALANGYVTFGCLNNFCKLNDDVLSCWAAVLRALPTSRLMLLAPSGSAREWVSNTLQTHGIDASRVHFEATRSRAEYLKLYHGIDVCLDTFPYNGHTTSLDAFWMGVPVITLAGTTQVSRAGVCQLRNLGLEELIAASPAEFVHIAALAGGDPKRLASLRRTLRARMAKSPLMDAERFARALESAYIELWNRSTGARYAH